MTVRRRVRAVAAIAAVALVAGMVGLLPASGQVVPQLMVSTQADRSGAVPLSGAALSGDVYVFLEGSASGPVYFWIDDPDRSGPYDRKEGRAPFDLVGGTASTAKPLDADGLGAGSHGVTAQYPGGVVQALFAVGGTPPPPPPPPPNPEDGVLSASPSRVTMDAATGGGPVSTSVVVSSTVPGVAVSVTDNRGWLSVSPVTGAAPATFTVTAKPGSRSAGTTMYGKLTISAPGHDNLTVKVVVSVVDTVPPPPPPDPEGGVLSASPSRVTMDAAAGGGPVTTSVVVSSTVPGATVSVTDNRGWLSVSPVTGAAPATFTVTANPGSRSAGTTMYGKLTISAPGHDNLTVQVVVSVVDTTPPPQLPCEPVACEDIKVELPFVNDFSELAGGAGDKDGQGTGFTAITRTVAGSGYEPDAVDLQIANNRLRLTTRAGTNLGAGEGLVNNLTVGIGAPDAEAAIEATVDDIPAGTGQGEQAGATFGIDQNNYAKTVVASRGSGPQVEFGIEVDGVFTQVGSAPVAAGDSVKTRLISDPATRTITGEYSVDGGPVQSLGATVAPDEFFSFDAAGIDPRIGTRSFAGIMATHSGAANPLVYDFDDFAVTEVYREPPPPPDDVNIGFDVYKYGVPFPTAMVYGPDGKLYVTEIFGTVHRLTFGANGRVTNDETFNPIGSRLTLGIEVDPASTPGNVILWLAHSDQSVDNGAVNSSTVSRVSGANLGNRSDVITGLPRAIANHAINHIHFGPDGRLYMAMGGNTGGGAPPKDTNSEFGDRPEQPLSAAIAVADVKAAGFDGRCATPIGQKGIPNTCDVEPYATGLRNIYDFDFHSNGLMYGTDNGLGVKGAYPPSPTPDCRGESPWPDNDPGTQLDELNIIEEGKYYGHPNPSRDECVFADGSYQGVDPLPNYEGPIAVLGEHLSSNGIIEYEGEGAFCGVMDGDLLIANYSQLNNLMRVQLAPDGRSVTKVTELVQEGNNPLALEMMPNGVIAMGLANNSTNLAKIVFLTPKPTTNCSGWTTETALPADVLDAGGAAVGDDVYVIGGKNATGPVNKTWVYDTTTKSWSAGPNFPGVAVEGPAVAAIGSKIYVAGGSTGPFNGGQSQLWELNTVSGSWSQKASMPTARGGAGAAVRNGRLVVVGGINGGDSLNAVEEYNPATDSWSTLAPLVVPRDNPAVAAVGDTVYAIGGRHRQVGANTLASGEKLVVDTWSPIAPMPTGRRAVGVGTIDGRVQVVGGEATGSDTFDVAEEYDPASDTWRTLADPDYPRHGTASATVNGRLHLIGGGERAGGFYSSINEVLTLG